MSLKGRVLGAFLVAPLASGFAHAVHTGSLRSGLVALLVAYAATSSLGVPTWLYFSRRGWSRLWQAALAGICMGIVAAFVVLILISFENGRAVSGTLTSYFLLLFSLHGLLVACLLRMLVSRWPAPRRRSLTRRCGQRYPRDRRGDRRSLYPRHGQRK